MGGYLSIKVCFPVMKKLIARAIRGYLNEQSGGKDVS